MKRTDLFRRVKSLAGPGHELALQQPRDVEALGRLRTIPRGFERSNTARAILAAPFMTLIIAGSVASIPEDLKAAARTLGAGRLTTFFRVELPLALPGITAATLLVFVTSTGAFAVPYLLGPIYPRPLSVWMYEEAMHENNWGIASAMGIVLSLVACIILLIYYRLTTGMRHAFGGEVR